MVGKNINHFKKINFRQNMAVWMQLMSIHTLTQAQDLGSYARLIPGADPGGVPGGPRPPLLRQKKKKEGKKEKERKEKEKGKEKERHKETKMS